MDLCKIRNEISRGESIYNIPLRVTFYARVSTDKDEQLNSLDNQILYFKNFTWLLIKTITCQNTMNKEYLETFKDEKR